ncbi:M1 family metallopeptidase [Asticcacaulis sp. AND118]|uniref:M1 family metallopeptidase n=1 Tax=Asticcacaulis sp. AND118 TaxID=2840468 RepID=UPI001CFFF4ED|nr:M1 family metallopeptidase [Asticcacaulis sp. AND118]UDF03320.1 M1 family metallopeptidase [Asticcacaulis sp. AND118]
MGIRTMRATGFTPNRRTATIGLMAALMGTTFLTACEPKVQPASDDSAPLALVRSARDVHSYAEPNVARVRHVDLDLTADFRARVLKGTAALTLETAPTATQVVLDTKALAIEGVTDASGNPLKYTLGKPHPIFGAPLTIELPQGAQKVVVKYATTADTQALQWLDPSQTEGKQHPFLLSQGQSILTRTWIPTQDSPAVRQTYSAIIRVPTALKAVMSAEMLTPDGEAVSGNSALRAYRFKMEEAIPPYLIALAIGDIAFRPTGKRTGVYAEKAMIERSATELSDLEQFVAAAEKLYGEYRWGRYDVLILPPSFPFGGMENPRLTFATPTILAGDKSLVSLIAHELAHSWSGNLVTNATWDDFWLNEGFTSYFENRIMEEMYGKDRALMLQSLGYTSLQAELADIKEPGLTQLHTDLKGRDPDDGFSEIPYEKGAALVRLLEQTYGRKKFDAWLKGYFTRYAFKSMTTAGFVEDLRETLLKGDPGAEDRLKLNEWLYKPGLPSNAIRPLSEAFNKVEMQAEAFAKGTPAKSLLTEGWVTQEWQHFIESLPDNLTAEQLKDLDAAFGFTTSRNSEILFAWLKVAIAQHYEPAMPALENFLTSQGRRKFVSPLFTALMAQKGWGVEMARRVYAEARPLYHAVTRATVDGIVK